MDITKLLEYFERMKWLINHCTLKMSLICTTKRF
jgi:hypothetical protein